MGDSSSDWRRFGSALLRPLSGYEEEWLARHRAAPSALAASEILNACVIGLDDETPTHDAAQRMLVGDRDYLILQLRRLTLGDRIQAVLNCPRCDSKMDVNLDVSAIPVEGRATDRALHQLELAARDGFPSRVVQFRLPTGADQEAILGLDVSAASQVLFERCVVDSGGIPFAHGEQDAIINAIEEAAPRVEVELDLTCPECAHGFLMPLDTTAFFLDEIRIGAGQLLREVHSLAFYYHWNESEILGLVRERRRSYLSMLSDSLRQE